MNTNNEKIEGNVIVDSISSLTWTMKNTEFKGAINSTGNTTVNADGTLSINVDNTSGTGAKYANFFTSLSNDIETSTDYVHIVDLKSKSLTGTITYNLSSTKGSSTSQINNNSKSVNSLAVGLNHINTIRINLTLETYDESIKIIRAFLNKINGLDTDFKFNNETDTRGHFNKEIL